MKISHKVQKFTVMLLLVVMFVSSMPANILEANAATTQFAGGSGTASDPYLIETKEQLDKVRNKLDAHYKLVKDIEFVDSDFETGGIFYNEGKGWIPIGSKSPYFTGVFDGNGYSVKNLHIMADGSIAVYAGLFGENQGTILNLGVEDSSILATTIAEHYAYVGGVASYNYGTISNCYITGNVAADGSGSGIVGGIVGVNYGFVDECYNAGMISSTCYAGGIAGRNGSLFETSGAIKNCYNIGMINATKTTAEYAYAGGIAASSYGEINCCYNIGFITSSDVKGGMIGIGGSNDVLGNCYYLDNVDDRYNYNEDATKCTIEHLKSQITFGGFDFDTVWTMVGDEDYLYPELINTPMDFRKEIQGTGLSALPYKTEYYAGLEELDVSGGKIAVVYNDGTYTEIELDKTMVTGFDNSQVGKQTLNVTYNGVQMFYEVEHLALVYDYKKTTDESITLEYTAKKEFDFVLSDETVAEITNVSSSTISFGSSVQMTSAATIKPLKPGYVVVRAIDKEGNVLQKSLLLIEEGNHQMQVLEVLKEVSCTEPGKEIHKCKFCGHQEEVTVDNLGHTEVIDKAVAPTCTKTGLTEGKHCSACDEVLIAQSVIQETGEHIWDDGRVDKSGDVYYSCDTCDATYSKALTSIEITTLPTKLSYIEGEELSFDGLILTAYYDDGTKAIVNRDGASWPGLTPGTRTITVTYKSKTATFSVSVTCLMHDFGAWEVIQPSTTVSEGVKKHTCNKCSYEESQVIDKIKTGVWKLDGIGWWYQNPDGTYPANGWKEIEEVWYYFNASGYILTGWQSIGGTWYYFDGSGAMMTGWQLIGGTWYYFNGSGAMVTGWQSIGGTWYYFVGSGAMMTGWQSIGGTWYYFNGSGAMVTGWQSIGGTWYYFVGSGAMVTGWQLIDGTWYYFEGSGAMVANRWVGNYYLQADGSMATNKWIGNYYVGADGVWVP